MGHISRVVGVVASLCVSAAGALVLSPLPVTAAHQAHSDSGLCFGHQGVQIRQLDAFECLAKDRDEGGALYWQQNNSDYEWNLHPDAGNLVVNAITTRISPENNYYGFLAVVASSEGGCVVRGAGYDRHPTRCANPGKPAKRMSPREQASYNDFAEYMREMVPGCAWMPTGAAGTC